VLFASSHPIVADFGIAKAVTSRTSGAQLTRTGISLAHRAHESGTSRRFRRRQRAHRRYSLAVLVYEMIVVEVPGRW